MKVLLLILSHLALGLAGWGIARMLQAPPAPPAPVAATKSARPASFHPAGDALVRHLRAELAKQAAAEAKAVPPEQLLREKILARLHDLAPSADPAAACREAVAAAGDDDARITAAARFVLWAQADPAGAIAFSADGLGKLSSNHADLARELAGERMAPEVPLPIEESLDYRHHRILRGMLRGRFARSSAPQLVDFVNGLQGKMRQLVEMAMVEQWPADRLDDFGAFMTALDDPELIPGNPEQWSREEFSEWLLRFANHHPDREFAARLKDSGTFASLLRFNSDFPLSVRLNGEVTPREMEQLLVTDVPKFFFGDQGADLLYRFRHGRLEAGDVLSQLADRFPEYADAGLLHVPLHQQLWVEDPARTAALLDHLPEKERLQALAETIADPFHRTPLDTLREFLRAFPMSVDVKLLATRESLLDGFAGRGLEKYGPDYLEWIATLPEPSDRTEALRGISRLIESASPDGARELRRIVGDTPLPATD